MPVEIRVPSVGESITEGTLARWFKKNGAAVRVDEPLFELETEKATTEVVSPGDGVLRITVPEGQRVQIGAVVGAVDGSGAAPRETTPAAAAPPAVKPVGAPTPAPASQPAPRAQTPTPTSTAPRATEPALPPSLRRLAAASGIDPSRIRGSGPQGLILQDDVAAATKGQNAVQSSTAAPASSAVAPSGGERRQRMTSIRARIAERLIHAQQTAAILTTFNEVDMSAVMDLRAKYKESFQKKHGISLGFMSFFVKAAVEALKAFPVVNSWIDGSDVVYHDYHHIGVAVSTEKGLMVPVVRNADKLSFSGIEKAITELAGKARDGKISVNDLQGGTFTITNGGIFGSLLSTPILNPPQSAILGMHSIQKRPVAVQDQVVIRPMMYLALSYDHRLVDGREAVQFLVRIKECIENPERLLLEV